MSVRFYNPMPVIEEDFSLNFFDSAVPSWPAVARGDEEAEERRVWRGKERRGMRLFQFYYTLLHISALAARVLCELEKKTSATKEDGGGSGSRISQRIPI